ncbi:MAG: FecR domain-containing protein [Burkholderiales bacterium]
MQQHVRRCAVAAVALAAVVLALPASAAEIGRIKTARGQVVVERDGAVRPASVGMRVQAADSIRTGDDAAVGITMDDDSLLSAGPNTVLVLSTYAFDPTTNQGRLDAAVNKGTLAVVSGRIAKQSPDAMTVRTPTAVLGVRGTTFAVQVNE